MSAFGRAEIRALKAKPGCTALYLPMRGMDQASVAILREARPCIEQRLETFEREHLVAVLRPPVSRSCGEARRHVNGPHRAFGLVLMLGPPARKLSKRMSARAGAATPFAAASASTKTPMNQFFRA